MRVPKTGSLEKIIGPAIDVKVTASIEEQRKFLEELDRQVAEAARSAAEPDK